MLVPDEFLYPSDQPPAIMPAASSRSTACKRVTVLGLGDLGRSPRMQFHALALADGGTEVDVVAYGGTAPYRRVREHARIRCHLLRAPVRVSGTGLLGYALRRVLRDGGRLLRLLLIEVGKPDVILVQNPPSVPTLLLAWVAARSRGARLIVDWHNFGYAMLGLRLGRQHIAVRAARRYEQAMSKAADAHLCVSQAMQAVLRQWGVEARVLYDRPAEIFAPVPAAERDALLGRLCADIAARWFARDGQRPAIIVSPTSWTEDEDFTLLLDAVERCEALIESHDRDRSRPPATPVVILLTGAGPLRSHYEAIIRRRTARKIDVHTAWFAPEDYPQLLGAADLGLCLHRSASGVDLPMKVADMFGAGLPVCALDYGPCLAEQIHDGHNGLLFTTSTQLAAHLYRLFNDPEAEARLEALRQNVARQPLSWQDGWKLEAAPLFTGT